MKAGLPHLLDSLVSYHNVGSCEIQNRYLYSNYLLQFVPSFQGSMGLVVGILMGVGGARMELGIVVILVEVVMLVLIDLHCWCLSCS